MTFDNEIDKVKSEIEVLQSKLEFLEELENTKTPAEEAYKRIYGAYPMGEPFWVVFKKGYEAHQSLVDDANKIIRDTASMINCVLEGNPPDGYSYWNEWFRECGSKGILHNLRLSSIDTKTSEPYCPDDPPEYDEIEWDEKDNPPEPTRNKYFERILNAPIDERGYIDLREPTSEFRQKLFDGIKSVFYDPDYERTHWSVKVNMAVDEVLTHFQDIIPASQDPIYDDIDKGWNLCLTKIEMSMEHTNE